ncbi:MAG: hypothetical protein MPW15_20070 [Candidatus Manganitrophus sp.]|nr:hypothetical protein [Candidatus Manganitrophus sp.]
MMTAEAGRCLEPETRSGGSHREDGTDGPIFTVGPRSIVEITTIPPARSARNAYSPPIRTNSPSRSHLLGVHSSSNGFDFSRNPQFGYVGQAFIAQFGDQAPVVGKVLSPVGFKVVRVDVETGVIDDFAVNKGKTNGPASRIGGGGLERPVAARFNPNGTALYVVDFGVLTMGEGGEVRVPFSEPEVTSEPRKGNGCPLANYPRGRGDPMIFARTILPILYSRYPFDRPLLHLDRMRLGTAG